VAACGLLGLSIYVLIKAEDILGFRVATDLSPDNPTAVHFSILLVNNRNLVVITLAPGVDGMLTIL
jgi:hypothetical protein